MHMGVLAALAVIWTMALGRRVRHHARHRASARRREVNFAPLMRLPTTTATPGRHLMVLDDAETIARQARRQAVIARRRRESLKGGAVVAGFAIAAAILAGASLTTVLLALGILALLAGLGLHHQQHQRRHARRHAARLESGHGVGTPRPKGGFSTTRHRSGAPVWVDHRTA